MNHLDEDRLLRLAYGELPESDTADAEAHLAACASCRRQLVRMERARVALDWATLRARHRAGRWAAAALAAAAMLAVVLLRTRPQPQPVSLHLPRYAVPELAPLDSLLTRLEQEKPYAIR